MKLSLLDYANICVCLNDQIVVLKSKADNALDDDVRKAYLDQVKVFKSTLSHVLRAREGF